MKFPAAADLVIRSGAGVKSNGVIVAADLRYGSRTRDLYQQHPKR